MNNLDKSHLALYQDILDNGTKKKTRTGTDSISVFGREIRHKMSEGFPLLTSRKMYFKGIFTELLWFLRGDTNIKYLLDNDCNIWVGDAYKNYKKKVTEVDSNGKIIHLKYPEKILTKEEFINKIKTDNEFAKKWGELGPIYGRQWRGWANLSPTTFPRPEPYMVNQIDQISNLINDLKANPDDRGLIVSAWNVGELKNMVLRPCHNFFQVYTRELSLEERINYYEKINFEYVFDAGLYHMDMKKVLDDANVPTRSISLKWNQRSVDTPLGLSSNIPSYSLLLMIIGKLVNMVPEELIGSLGDCHIYENQIDGVREQMGRELSIDERIDLAWSGDYINGNEMDFDIALTNAGADITGKKTIEVLNYYEIPERTREPFPLPTLKFSGKLETIFQKYRGEETFGDNPDLGYYNQIDAVINSMEPSDFIVENYKYHPKINFPLSN